MQSTRLISTQNLFSGPSPPIYNNVGTTYHIESYPPPSLRYQWPKRETGPPKYSPIDQIGEGSLYSSPQSSEYDYFYGSPVESSRRPSTTGSFEPSPPPPYTPLPLLQTPTAAATEEITRHALKAANMALETILQPQPSLSVEPSHSWIPACAPPVVPLFRPQPLESNWNGIDHHQTCKADTKLTVYSSYIYDHESAGLAIGIPSIKADNDRTAQTSKRPRKRKEIPEYSIAPASSNQQWKCQEKNCPRAFGRKEHLDRHTRSHTGVRPYSCNLCGQKFSRSDNRNEHQRRTHAPRLNGKRGRNNPRKLEYNPQLLLL